MKHSLLLSIFDKEIHIETDSAYLFDAVTLNYSAFIHFEKNINFDIEYELYIDETKRKFEIIRNNETTLQSSDLGLFVYQLEKDITIELQYLCSSLFFMHGAALEYNGEVLLLTGRSGAGKSTTTWGLLNNGFNYLSDELAPVNLESMHVAPYPHAVCLKKQPPLYPLPDNILQTNRTMHVPTALLPADSHLESFPLTKVIIVEYSADNMKPVLTKLSQASACMNIYSNGLNQLAHENDGLTGASRIAESCECYSLAAAELDDTCKLISSLFE